MQSRENEGKFPIQVGDPPSSRKIPHPGGRFKIKPGDFIVGCEAQDASSAPLFSALDFSSHPSELGGESDASCPSNPYLQVGSER